MFMSAREIKATHQPIWGDVGRKFDYSMFDGGGGWRNETQDETWERKAEESRERGPMGGGQSPLTAMGSLADHIEDHGVKFPVTLEDPSTAYIRTKHNGDPDSKKPYVLGGHHRIAIMGENHPDDLIPVQHNHDVFEAKKMGQKGSY